MKTNQSLFSPARLVYMAGPEVKDAAPKNPEPGTDSKVARQALYERVEAQLKKMDDGPDKSALETFLTNAKLAEALGGSSESDKAATEKTAQDAALNLLERLGNVSGDKTLEARASAARKKIEAIRAQAFVTAKNRFTDRNRAVLDSGKVLPFEHEGKLYSVQRLKGSNPSGLSAYKFTPTEGEVTI